MAELPKLWLWNRCKTRHARCIVNIIHEFSHKLGSFIRGIPLETGNLEVNPYAIKFSSALRFPEAGFRTRRGGGQNVLVIGTQISNSEMLGLEGPEINHTCSPFSA
jgi:hypothetical protein